VSHEGAGRIVRLAASQSHVYAEAGTGEFWVSAAETYGPLAATAGTITADQVERWLDDQRRSAADGTFFASCNYYAYVAER
jgi:hypothetical protein